MRVIRLHFNTRDQTTFDYIIITYSHNNSELIDSSNSSLLSFKQDYGI